MTKHDLSVIAVTCLVLVSLTTTVNWQASGIGGWSGIAMSDAAPNLPRLEAMLDRAVTDLNAQGSRKAIIEAVSSQCNTLWDDAWNVGVAQLGSPQADMVLYGYVFRNHWAWYNMYKGSAYSFVVWKDYNCAEWSVFDSQDVIKTNDQEYSTAVTGAIDSSFSSWISGLSQAGNVWQAAKTAIDAAENYIFRAATFSGIAFETLPGGGTSDFAAIFCYGGKPGQQLWSYVSLSELNSNTGNTQEYNILLFTTREGNYNPST